MFFASLAAAATAALSPVPHSDTDLRCLTTYLFVVGQMEEDAEAKETEKLGVSMLATYYLGRIKGRYPGVDVGVAVRSLVQGGQYNEAAIGADIEMCNADTKVWTADLDKINLNATD